MIHFAFETLAIIQGNVEFGLVPGGESYWENLHRCLACDNIFTYYYSRGDSSVGDILNCVTGRFICDEIRQLGQDYSVYAVSMSLT